MQKIKLEREMKITHDCGGEFTLPDYVPAIGRMLSAVCEPSPEGVYLKEAEGRGVEAELGGIASFRVLYVPEDGGDVRGVTIPCDYDTNVIIGGVSTPVTCRASTLPENVFCRVTAPRKLQLRCRLGSKLTVLSSSDADSSDEFQDDMEVKRGAVEAMALSSGTSRDLMCASDLEGLPEGAVPVLCRARIAVTDCKPVGGAGGEYRCRGDITVECLYMNGGELSTLRDRIGFDETVAVDGTDGETPDETIEPRAYGRITFAELHHDDSGSRAEVIYELGIETVTPLSAGVVYDAYSVTVPVAAEYDDMEYLSPAVSGALSVSVNERIPKNVSGRVPYITADAELTGASAEAGRVKVSGELRGTALIVSDGEYDAVPWSAPWSCELTAAGISEGDDVSVWGDVGVTSVSARADGELAVDAEVSVSVTAAVHKREHVLASVKPNGEPFPARSGFTVCYPSRSETVWDIAKRYHVPTSTVASAGNVTPDGTPASVVVI